MVATTTTPGPAPTATATTTRIVTTTVPGPPPTTTTTHAAPTTVVHPPVAAAPPLSGLAAVMPLLLGVLVIILIFARFVWPMLQRRGQAAQRPGGQVRFGLVKRVTGGEQFIYWIKPLYIRRQDLSGYGQFWHALALLVDRDGVRLVRLSRTNPIGGGMWTIVDVMPGVPILLTDSDFVTKVNGIDTALLVNMGGIARPVNDSDVVKARIFNSPAVVCTRVGGRRGEDPDGQAAASTTAAGEEEVLDPVTTLQVIESALTGGGVPGDVVCTVHNTVNEALMAASSAVGLLNVGNVMLLMPINVSELLSREYKSGTARALTAHTQSMLGIYRYVERVLRSSAQATFASGMRNVMIFIGIAILLAVILAMLHGIIP